jgi:hypothetical protein
LEQQRKKDSSLKSVLLGYDFGENSADLHNQKEAKILMDLIGNGKKTFWTSVAELAGGHIT